MGLQRYKQKRNFNATPEPKGKVARRAGRALTFVIQKHDATRLHYDFRLELEGVLKSWAVPKGIPTSKGDRRLAMHVEDHPLDYGGFEGIIPEGNYGAGSVMVWDTGTWEALAEDASRALQDGKLKFTLHGSKLEGEWTLVRMRARSNATGKDEWLLIKSGADTRPIPAAADDRSALTKRTMAQIAGQKTRTWQSNRDAAAPKKQSFKTKIAAAARRAAGQRGTSRSATPRQRVRASRTAANTKKSTKDVDPAAVASRTGGLAGDRMETARALQSCPMEEPRYVEPMKARLVEKLPAGEPWWLEVKHDGFRAIAVKNGRTVSLYSRSHRDMTREFPAIAEAIAALPAGKLVIDGEIVALNEQGHGSFQLLQNRGTFDDHSSVVFYVFDLLNLDGRSIRELRFADRRALLEPLLNADQGTIRFSATLPGPPEVILAEVKRLGLEGVIAKKPASRYEAGQRSGSWVKLKCVNEQEFVIGGFTPPKGSRDFFGALLVGYYEKGELLFASKVGSGYTQRLLRELHKQFQPLRRATCPFVNLPTRRGGRFGQGIGAAAMKRCTWLEPRLVAQVRFTEWTSDGGLRHPVFLGLRDDKKPSEVTKEIPSPAGNR